MPGSRRFLLLYGVLLGAAAVTLIFLWSLVNSSLDRLRKELLLSTLDRAEAQLSTAIYSVRLALLNPNAAPPEVRLAEAAPWELPALLPREVRNLVTQLSAGEGTWTMARQRDRILVVGMVPVEERRRVAWVVHFPQRVASAWVQVDLRAEPLPEALQRPLQDSTGKVIGYLVATPNPSLAYALQALRLLFGVAGLSIGLLFLIVGRAGPTLLELAPLREFLERVRENLQRGVHELPPPPRDPLSRELARHIQYLLERLQAAHREEMQAHRQMRFFRRIVQSVATASTLDVAVHEFLKELRAVIPHAAIVIRILEKETDTLRLVASEGLPPEQMHRYQRIPLTHGLAGRVATTGEPRYVENYDHESPLGPGVRTGFYYAYAVPIFSFGELVGTLTLLTKKEHPLTPDQRVLAQTAAYQFGIAYEGLLNYFRIRGMKEFLESLIRDMWSATLVLDEDGRITLLNPAVSRLTGRPENEWMNRHWSELLRPEDRPKAEEMEKQVRQRLVPVTREFAIPNPEEEVFVVATLTRLFSGDESQRFLLQFADVTEIKRTQQEIELAREFRERVLQSLPLGVAVLTTEGKPRYTNALFGHLLGLEWSDQGFPPRGRAYEPLRTIWQDALAGSSGEAEIQLPERGFPCLRVRIFPLQQQQILVLVEDISKEKEFLEKLMDSERLLSTGILLRGLLNEINNPLAAIRSAVEVLRSRCLEEDVAPLVKALEEGAARLQQTVQSLEFLARPEVGVQKEWIPLAQFLNDLLQEFQRDTRELGVTLEAEIPENLPDLYLHKQLLRLVLCELLRNALTTYRERGRKGILRFSVRLLEEDQAIAFVVSDDAGGMSPAVRERAFEPYFTTRTDPEARGLGLSTVRSIVRAFGGTIHLESELGRGTRVEIRLPTEVPRPPEEPSVEHPLAGKRILLIEDDPQVGEVIRVFLEEQGAETVLTRTAEEALTQIMHTRFDAILLDLHLPDADPEEVLRLLERQEPEALARTIIITGDPSAAHRHPLLRQHQLPLLAKPFSIHDLRAALGQVVSL